MSEMKPTPGPLVPQDREKITSIPLKAIDCERLGISVCFVNGHREAEAKANAILISEAFNVHHNTGLSPVQLVEMVGELSVALSNLGWAAQELDRRNRIRQFDAFVDAARAARAKCEGVKL